MAGFFDLVRQYNTAGAPVAGMAGSGGQTITPEEAMAMYNQMRQNQQMQQYETGQQTMGRTIGTGAGSVLRDFINGKMQAYEDKRTKTNPVAPEDDPGASQSTAQSVAADILQVASRDGPDKAREFTSSLIKNVVERGGANPAEMDAIRNGALLAEKYMKDNFAKPANEGNPTQVWQANPATGQADTNKMYLWERGPKGLVPVMDATGKQAWKESGSAEARAGAQGGLDLESKAARDKERTTFMGAAKTTDGVIKSVRILQGLMSKGTTGDAGRLVAGATNLVSTVQGLWSVMGAPRRDDPEILGAMSGGASSLDGVLKEFEGTGLWKNLEAKGVDSQRIRAMYVALAYATAKGHEENGRIATADVENALREIGGQLSNPAAASQVLDDVTRRLVSNLHSTLDFSNLAEDKQALAFVRRFDDVVPYVPYDERAKSKPGIRLSPDQQRRLDELLPGGKK